MSTYRFLTLCFYLAVLFGCSGSADNANTLAKSNEVPSLTFLGDPIDNSKVFTAECAKPTDPASTGSPSVARYPKVAGTLRGWPSSGSNAAFDYQQPLQIRSDQIDGFIVSHSTSLNGAMFQISPDGIKSLLPLPYSSVFDVSLDGSIWFASGSNIALGNKDGKFSIITNVASGKISLIAAGKNAVYVLSEEGELSLGLMPVSTMSRSLMVISRQNPELDVWNVKSIPMFNDLDRLDVISSMRVGPSDELLLLLNKPFHQLLDEKEVWPGVKSFSYAGLASVRVLSPTGTWLTLASKSFSTSSSTNYTRGYTSYSYDLDAKDLSIAKNGTIWVGGAGVLYSVDAVNGWTLVASPLQISQDFIGHDGDIGEAGFASAVQLVASNSELVFYDGETCQIRKFKDHKFSTISGPMLAEINFASVGFMGQDSSGNLLFTYGKEIDDLQKIIAGSYQKRINLAKVKLNDQTFKPIKLKSVASFSSAVVCTASASYWVLSGCSGAPNDSKFPAAYWLGLTESGQLLRREGQYFYTEFAGGNSTFLSTSQGFPGVLDGDAPSGPSGIHLDANHLYLFGWVRTDPPVQKPITYHELRIYKLDIKTGIANSVAGATVPMGLKTDLTPIIPSAGGGPAFIQHRGDGSFWLSNGKEIWILDAFGNIRRIAGLSNAVVAKDGVGDSSSFGFISGIRLLPDKRLMVIDHGAHAIRFVSESGKVETKIGKLNQPGQSVGPLPALLENPIDAFVMGRNIYISTMKSRQLTYASFVF